MSNENWVCFDCHETKRRQAHCPNCDKEMVCIGMKIAVPPKRDEQAWVALRKTLGKRRRDDEQKTFDEAVRRRHDLEQEVERLEAMPANPGRTKTIHRLRKQLLSV